MVHLSENQQKRWEYEQREKAIRDYNFQMKTATRRGLQQGIDQGISQGINQGVQKGEEIRLIELILKKVRKGLSDELIMEHLEISSERELNLLAHCREKPSATAEEIIER